MKLNFAVSLATVALAIGLCSCNGSATNNKAGGTAVNDNLFTIAKEIKRADA